MYSLIDFLGSNMALVGSILIAAYAIISIALSGNDMEGLILPMSLHFLWPVNKHLVEIVFYICVLYFLIPFLASIGFPIIPVLMICLAYVYMKVFNWRIEYSAALSVLTVLMLGTLV
jgi:hypothetical protein